MKTEEKITSAIKETGHILDMWLPLRIQYDKVPGASIAIVYKGKVMYQKGFGYADVESETKAEADTAYRIASISKIFTSVAILQLVEKGKIQLDDLVSTYVSWFKGSNKQGTLEDITIRQLLSNSSGLWRDGGTAHWITGEFPKNLKSSVSDNLIFEPASEFKYSNYGFSILGEIIQTVTGLSYSEYMQKNILGPLGMASTFPDYDKSIENIANGYGRVIPDSPREKFEHYATHAYAPATGFVSTAADLMKFLAALPLNGSEKILSRKYKREMTQPYRDIGYGEYYCLGIEEYTIHNKKVYGHSGGFNGFITKIAFDQENEIGVVVLTNALRTPVSIYMQSIFEMIYTIAAHEAEYSLKKKVSLKKYEGVYRDLWGDHLFIQIKDVLVAFDMSTRSPLEGENKVILHPKAKNIFSSKGGSGFDFKGEPVEFADFKNGKAQTVIVGGTPSQRIA